MQRTTVSQELGANPVVTNSLLDSHAKPDVYVRVATKSVSSYGRIGPANSCLKMSLTAKWFSRSPND